MQVQSQLGCRLPIGLYDELEEEDELDEPVGVGVTETVGVGEAVGAGVLVGAAVGAGVLVGTTCVQVVRLTLPTQEERIQSWEEQVLPIFWQILMQSVSPQTNEARVGKGMGVLVGFGRSTWMPEVGRMIGPVEEEAPEVTVGALGVSVMPAAEGDGVGVPVVAASPLALVVNVQGTPPLSYFWSPMRTWK